MTWPSFCGPSWRRDRPDRPCPLWNTPLKPVVDLASAEESLRSRIATQEEGTSVSCCVTDEATGEILGNISLHKVERVFRSAKTGYWVLPEARGRRVATRALTLLSRWAFPTLGLHRIELDHALGHDASCRIAEKCGYPYEGTLRGAMFESGRHDAFRDSHLHARLATDPEISQGSVSRLGY